MSAHRIEQPLAAKTEVRSLRALAKSRRSQGSTFGKYLDAANAGHVVFDPGMKIENASVKPKVKARSQFRSTANQIHHLYDQIEAVNLIDG